MRKQKNHAEVDAKNEVDILKAFIEVLDGEITYISNTVEKNYSEENEWYQFIVELTTEDGDPYSPFGDEDPIAFHVKVIDDSYKVMELPSISLK